MGKLVLSHVKMMSSISSIKLVRNKSLVDIIVEVHHFDAVAPARERGLKCKAVKAVLSMLRRSREGAWIEMPLTTLETQPKSVVAPERERGLK